MSSHRLLVDVVPQEDFGGVRRQRGHAVLVRERVEAVKRTYAKGNQSGLPWGDIVLAIVRELNASVDDGNLRFTDGEVDAALRYLWGEGEIAAPEDASDAKSGQHVATAGV